MGSTARLRHEVVLGRLDEMTVAFSSEQTAVTGRRLLLTIHYSSMSRPGLSLIVDVNNGAASRPPIRTTWFEAPEQLPRSRAYYYCLLLYLLKVPD